MTLRYFFKIMEIYMLILRERRDYMMTAALRKENSNESARTEKNTKATVLVLKQNTCQGCSGTIFGCEQAHLNCRACVTMPELFVSQR